MVVFLRVCSISPGKPMNSRGFRGKTPAYGTDSERAVAFKLDDTCEFA
jgi:hypothetical protein